MLCLNFKKGRKELSFSQASQSQHWQIEVGKGSQKWPLCLLCTRHFAVSFKDRSLMNTTTHLTYTQQRMCNQIETVTHRFQSESQTP